MFNNYEKSIEDRKSIIAILYQMAKSDDDVANVELVYLIDVAKTIGLEPVDVEEVLNHPEDFPLAAPTDEGDRMTILYYLLFMMRVDGIIEPREEKLVYEAGFRLGFNEKLIEDLIHVMKTYLNKEIPPEVMLEQIRKHLN